MIYAAGESAYFTTARDARAHLGEVTALDVVETVHHGQHLARRVVTRENLRGSVYAAHADYDTIVSDLINKGEAEYGWCRYSLEVVRYVVNVPGSPDDFATARQAWEWLADRHVEWCDDLEAIDEQVTRAVFDVDAMPDRPGFVRVEHPTEPGRVVLYAVSKR